MTCGQKRVEIASFGLQLCVETKIGLSKSSTNISHQKASLMSPVCHVKSREQEIECSVAATMWQGQFEYIHESLKARDVIFSWLCLSSWGWLFCRNVAQMLIMTLEGRKKPVEWRQEEPR